MARLYELCLTNKRGNNQSRALGNCWAELKTFQEWFKQIFNAEQLKEKLKWDFIFRKKEKKQKICTLLVAYIQMGTCRRKKSHFSETFLVE